MEEVIKKVFKIFMGNLFITFAYSFITIPNDIITGGTTGSAMIISDIVNSNVGFIANIITIALLVLCLIFLGKNYFINSLISSFFYMTLLNLFSGLGIHINLGIILNVIMGGILVGLGYKLTIDSEASTAGFDVIALIVNKYRPSVKVGNVLRYISTVVMLIGVFQFGVLSVILGIILVFIQTGTINRLSI